MACISFNRFIFIIKKRETWLRYTNYFDAVYIQLYIFLNQINQTIQIAIESKQNKMKQNTQTIHIVIIVTKLIECICKQFGPRAAPSSLATM